MAIVRLFAQAREAAGTSSIEMGGGTVGEILDAVSATWGPEFVSILQHSRVWMNGEPVTRETPVSDNDEVAVLPPVSGG